MTDTTRRRRTDYVLRDWTNVWWPGALPYRDEGARPGRGYRTEEAARERAYRVMTHYAATHGGTGGPDLRVVTRTR